MTPIILLAVLAGLPILNALFLRVNAIFLFASITVGNLLVTYLSDDVILAVNMFLRGKSTPMIVQLALLFLPVVLTLFFLRKSVPATKFLLHVLPIVGCGLSLAVLTVPLLPSNVQSQVFTMPFGNIFKQSQDLIISVTAVMILLLMWQNYRHREGKHGKKHH